MDAKMSDEPRAVAFVTRPSLPVAGAGDVELRLLEALAESAAHGIVCAYSSAKHSSRALGWVASSAETVVTKAGLVAVVKFVYEQYLRVGYPVVRYVDEAVGRCIVAAFVRVLLAVEYQQPDPPLGLLTANGESLQLTYYERLQALLYGHVPRLQGLILEMYACAERAKHSPPAVVFNPDEYVPKEEVERLQKDSSSALQHKEHELRTLQKELQAAERARQQLEVAVTEQEAAKQAKREQMLNEKEHEIAQLNAEIQAATRIQEELVEKLRHVEEQREGKLNTLESEREAEIAALKKQLLEAERGREQLRANLREALDLKDGESREALAVKEKEVAELKNKVVTAELEREKVERELKKEVEAAEAERKKIEQKLKIELELAEQARKTLELELTHELQAVELARKEAEATLQRETEAAEMARKKLEQELQKEKEAAELARKKMEQELQSKLEAAELARKTMEQEIEATRTRMESEHNNRVEELENELIRARLLASAKAADTRTDSLRQQRASFNANLVKDYVQHSKVDEPVTKPRAMSDNQREDEELSLSARSSTTSSSASPRASDEKKRAKREKDKGYARIARVLGSRF